MDGLWRVEVVTSGDEGRKESDEGDEEEEKDETIPVLGSFTGFHKDENG